MRPETTSTSPSDSRRPATIAALRRDGLRISARDGRALREQLADHSADVLVVRRSELTDEDLVLIGRRVQEDADASVVVVGSGLSAVERTRLLSAGVTHVVDDTHGSEWVHGALAAVARAEASSASVTDEPRLADFLSSSQFMRRFLADVRKVVDADSTLLVLGETGVGKERLARAVHAASRRAERPFISVNCGALSAQLLESELFGHRAGAFTGADRDRSGHFEMAQGGTVFLDEIGEMPIEMQIRLLTVLERKEVTPVGTSTAQPIDVRVIAATNRDLESRVEAGEFREDLYYRLNVVRLTVPSLRERAEDIPDLVGSMIAWYRRELERPEVGGITPRALETLMAHAWPGNVRELGNVIERAVLFCEGTEIRRADLPAELLGRPAENEERAGDSRGDQLELPEDWAEMPLGELRQQVIDQLELRYLTQLLQDSRGVITRAAERCGLARRSLYDRLRRHGLRREQFVESEQD